MVLIFTNQSYRYGVIDTLEDRAIPRGAASASLNWLTKGDHIELRRGQAFMGSASVNNGNGRATGLKRCLTAASKEILFGTYAKKLVYYDETTSEWIENGSNILGADVVDSNGLGLEDIIIEEYASPAGNQAFVNSPHCAGFFKLLVANPGSKRDMYNSSDNFKGYIKIDTNRTLLWGRTNDKTGLYGSHIDTQTYTTVTGEAVGLAGSLTYSGTLGAVSGTRTFFGVTFTDTSETFSDNYDGTLTGSNGGTGTINYITGAYSVTFHVVAVGAVSTTYQWEDSNAGGITDFTKSSPRLAGEGFIFRQDEGGGPIQDIGVFNTVYYCFHLRKTWELNIGSDDTSATNLPYREKVGMPHIRASVETGDGIYYIDDTDQNDVRVRLLTYALNGSAQVIPVSVSKNINLNGYNFDFACGTQWGDFVLFACATSDSVMTLDGETVPLNNRMLVYNRLWNSWDVLDYAATCFENYNGALVTGDALSNNFITLFSGFDDFDSTISNFWEGDLDDLFTKVPRAQRSRRQMLQGLKKSKKLMLRGLIAPSQKLKVSLAIDDGDFVEVGGTDNADGSHTYCIEGAGSYVDSGTRVSVGAVTLGRHEVGGGSSGAFAYNYERLISLSLDKFDVIKIRYEAIDVGFVSVSTQDYWDVRFKGKRVPSKYRG